MRNGKLTPTPLLVLVTALTTLSASAAYATPWSGQETPQATEEVRADITPEELDVLLSRVENLEGETASLRDALAAKEGEVASLRAQVAELEGVVWEVRMDRGIQESLALARAESVSRCERRQILTLLGAGAVVILAGGR